jgi:DNA polymerase III alpha subunit
MTIEVKKFNQNGEELAIRFGLGGIKAVGIAMIEEVTKNRQKNNNQFSDIYDFATNAGAKAINKKALEALTKAGAFDIIHPNRNQIVESVDIICKYATSKEEEKNSNQMSLFESADIVEKKPDLKNIDEWSQETKLQQSFKAFGFFLNEHPIDNFLDKLGKRGVMSSENLEEMSDGNIIKLAGVIAYSKHKSGPRGRYAYLAMSDPFGIYEVSIFDEALITTNRESMTDGTSLVVECLVKKDQGGSRFLVKSLTKLEEFIKQTSPKREAYRDIKQQEKRTEFDWKKKNTQQSSPKDDIVVWDIEFKRKVAELEKKPIINQISISIKNRQDILKLKSFLFQKLAPSTSKKSSKVYLITQNQEKSSKIELNDKYLISKDDAKKIGLDYICIDELTT